MTRNKVETSHAIVSSGSLADRLYTAVVVVVSIVAFIVVAYPLYFIVIASFSNSTMVNQGQVILWPKDINFYGYEQIFKDTRIWQGYLNTVIYTVLGTLLNLIVTLPCAYALAHKKFKARRIIMPLFVFTMYFGGGMIPTYLLIRDLHLLNTPWIMIVNGALSVFNLIITRTFFESSIPEELYEAAVLDGCSHFRYFISVVIPLSKAVISVISLYYMVGHWNDFFSALLYINSDELQPLQIILRNILLSNQAFAGGAGSGAGAGAGSYAQQFADQIKYAVIIVSTVPVLIIYPFLQKYFEKGVMIGAVKG
ncbi:carbohydrate ABC transporter permease [Paenibacillus sp. 19GGS1-52]|uniref:ABC transporter permease subunit n=1 Tax=Paenibacillus monticola TaxID=2666075 RepID=A0A7X2H6K2_9BACL|nr:MULTISPECIES: carbohydrate ABC transporter permease [Paenibacillus]MRN53733.1 ABC transporter permease subunit [Paenibacillus monticola]ULO09017.1 carbohydrate ABC transporter permease [Paenibacillus sp. 19GGS1-52]